jgi:hypothetical protein
MSLVLHPVLSGLIVDETDNEEASEEDIIIIAGDDIDSESESESGFVVVWNNSIRNIGQFVVDIWNNSRFPRFPRFLQFCFRQLLHPPEEEDQPVLEQDEQYELVVRPIKQLFD